MHKNTLPVSSHMALSVLLLGMLLSSMLSPIARREYEKRSLYIYGFLLEYDKPSLNSKNNLASDRNTPLVSFPIQFKLNEGSRQSIRVQVTDMSSSSLRTCMIFYIFLSCCCAIIAIILIIAAFVDLIIHPIVWKTLNNRRMMILLSMMSFFIGRFIVIIVMITRTELYNSIDDGYFVSSGNTYVHSGFSISLASVCVCILAVITLWNTNIG